MGRSINGPFNDTFWAMLILKESPGILHLAHHNLLHSAWSLGMTMGTAHYNKPIMKQITMQAVLTEHKITDIDSSFPACAGMNLYWVLTVCFFSSFNISKCKTNFHSSSRLLYTKDLVTSFVICSMNIPLSRLNI